MKLAKILLPIVSSAAIAIPPLTATTSCSHNRLDKYTWEEIKEISKSGEATKYFKIGDTKKVQLKTQDKNGNGKIDKGEFYQTVRIIGFNHDYDINSKIIGITFEFADKICDINGYSLATYWNSFGGEDADDKTFENLDYRNSWVRSALVGDDGDTSINWFKYYGEEGERDANKHFVGVGDEVRNKSVLSMLPDDLKNAITPAAKLVNVCTKKEESEFKFIEHWQTDPLFLLSPIEVGYDQCVHERWCPIYEYYEGHTTWKDGIRIKSQLATKGAAKEARFVLDGWAKSEIKCSYAGCNNITSACPDWLRTPNDYPTQPCAFAIDDISGLVTGHTVRETACSVAPAFCI